MTIETTVAPPDSDYNVQKLFIAGNRGACAGVNMALETARLVLDIVKGREPVYVNWDLVNNRPMMAKLAAEGLTSISNNYELVPKGSILIFSAHGVSPSAHLEAKARDLTVIDATCQLVTRVHNLAIRAERQGKHVIYIGVDNHPETMGVMGELAPENITLIEKEADISELHIPADKPSIVFSQTTKSTREIAQIMRSLKAFDPEIEIPNRGDICFAADNRQAAVDELIKKVDALIVVGSPHSHNSQELRIIGENNRKLSKSVDTPDEIDSSWFDSKISRVGITSGASVLDGFLMPVIGWFTKRNPETEISWEKPVRDEEDRTFSLPKSDILAIRRRYDPLAS